MNIDELINEIIYFYRYFEIIATDNETLIAKEIVCRLENITFVENLLQKFKAEMRLKRFMNRTNKKRLYTLLSGLENIRIALFLDQILEKRIEDKLFNR